jgi:hypothetical protein
MAATVAATTVTTTALQQQQLLLRCKEFSILLLLQPNFVLVDNDGCS